MTRHQNPPMPASEFGLLLVEGGDERSVCRILAGPAWSQLCCWKADGRDLPGLARLAKNDANFGFARSVGIVLDAEGDVHASSTMVEHTLGILGASSRFVHGELTGSPRMGAFLSPDGRNAGAIETLCRAAVRDARIATCVDALVACAGTPHARRANSRVAEDKGWLKAYLGMLPEPDLRFHQAFEHPQGIDASHDSFAALRQFIQSL